MGTVLGGLGHRAQVASACAIFAVVPLLAAPPAYSQVDARRAEAAELKDTIEEHGRELSIANEEYNRAALARQRIAAQASAARGQVASAEDRWTALKTQLSKRVRLLYMHPGAAIDAWLGADSISDLARAHKLGSSVLTADTELILQTEKARQEVLARARRLDGIRSAAEAKEAEIASRRSEVQSALSEQRSLLSNVSGEIAQLLEEEQQRELAEARAAEQEEPADDPGEASPVIGDDDDPDPGPASTPAPEAVGPAPPVKSGASKAVATAAAQIGKPYEWAADGPDSYDCSGLTMYAWASAGVSLPHSSQAQYASLPHVARSQIQPGDLLFYGSPIHHVGIYEGGGVMINAPQTGDFVKRSSIARSDYVGAARP